MVQRVKQLLLAELLGFSPRGIQAALRIGGHGTVLRLLPGDNCVMGLTLTWPRTEGCLSQSVCARVGSQSAQAKGCPSAQPYAIAI
jgi:hypothetical protein